MKYKHGGFGLLALVIVVTVVGFLVWSIASGPIRKGAEAVLGSPLEGTGLTDLGTGTSSEVLTCPAPVLANLNCQPVSSESIQFVWTEVAGATGYRVGWCPGTVGENFVMNYQPCDSATVDAADGTVYPATGLDPGTNYNFKVYVVRSDGNVCKATSPTSVIGSCSTLQ